MHAIYGGHNDTVGIMIAGYFSNVTGYPITGPYTAMGWIKDQKLVAQAIFNDYTGANIELHFYGPKVLNKQVINDICDYTFKRLDCARITVKPYCTNEKLLQLVTRIGFVYEATQADFYRHQGKLVDAVVFKLTKNNASKWINK